MKLGLDDHTVLSAGHRATALELLDLAHRLSLDGVHFSTLASFDSRDAAYLAQVRRHADGLGLYIEVGMGACNPFSECRTPWEASRDPRDTLREMIAVATALGAPCVRTFFGFIRERFYPHVTLAQQLDATAAVLRDVAPFAEAAGVHIALENHFDLTSDELIGLIKAVGSPYVGVCFDTGNPLALLEEPLSACRVLLPHLVTTHIKDALVVSGADGAIWLEVTAGDGCVNLPAVLHTIGAAYPDIHLNIEDLPDLFPVPFLDHAFLDTLPALTVHTLADFVRLVRAGDARQSTANRAVMDLPLVERCRLVDERLPSNVARVREMVSMPNRT